MKKLSEKLHELSQHTVACKNRVEAARVEGRKEFEAFISEGRTTVQSVQDAVAARVNGAQDSLEAQWRRLDEAFTAQITQVQHKVEERKSAILPRPLTRHSIQTSPVVYGTGERVQLRSSARSITGRVFANNEDTVHRYARDQVVLAIVADGMGGAAAGDVASRIAVDTIHAQLIGNNSDDLMRFRWMEEDALVDTILDAIRTANIAIMEAAIHDPALKNMGTAVTLALVRGAEVVIAHVGHGRAYCVEGEERLIKQITTDHTVAQLMVAAGHITRAQAENHPMKKVLCRVLGHAEYLEIDIHFDKLRAGDALVLCSDGLTRHVKATEIMNIVLGQSDPDLSSQRLVDLANQRGGEDNISVIVMTAEHAQN